MCWYSDKNCSVEYENEGGGKAEAQWSSEYLLKANVVHSIPFAGEQRR